MTALAYAVAGLAAARRPRGHRPSRNLIELVVCLTVCQSSTYVLPLAIGFRDGAAAPDPQRNSRPVPETVDPVVQAMTLTDVVVEATVTALLLALAVLLHRRFGTLDPDDKLAGPGADQRVDAARRPGARSHGGAADCGRGRTSLGPPRT